MKTNMEQSGKHNIQQNGDNAIGTIERVRDLHNGDNINITININQTMKGNGMIEQEKAHLLDLEEVAYDLDGIANILDGLCHLASSGDFIPTMNKSLYLLSNLIGEKSAIIEEVMNNELSERRAANAKGETKMDEFENKVRESIKSDEVEHMTLISEPKGLYGADKNDGWEPIEIKAILQAEDGTLHVDTMDGITSFSFDFVGSPEDLEKIRKEQLCTTK